MATQVLKVNAGWWTFLPALRAREDFTTPNGTLYGMSGGCGLATGQLPEAYHGSARSADYTVWSYATPIAWHVQAVFPWITPEVSYSRTTSKHQGRIFTAISAIDNPAYCSTCGQASLCRCAHEVREAQHSASMAHALTFDEIREELRDAPSYAEREAHWGEYDQLIADVQAVFPYSNGLTH